MNQDPGHPSRDEENVEELLSTYRAGKNPGEPGKGADAAKDCGATRVLGEPQSRSKTASGKKSKQSPRKPDAKPEKEPDAEPQTALSAVPEAPEPDAPAVPFSALHFQEGEDGKEHEDVLATHLTEESEAEPYAPEESGEADGEGDGREDDPYAGLSKPKRIVKKIARGSLHLSFLPKALIYIAVVLIVSAYLSFYVIEVGNDVFALVTGSGEVSVTVPENATEEQITDLLLDRGLIDYEWAFDLFLQYYGKGEEIVFIPGEHKLDFSMNYSQLLNALTIPSRERVAVTLTFPEGFSVDDIIDLLLENGIGTREGYIEAINHYPYKHEFVRLLDENGWPADRVYRLEGYLYPDTYDFYTDTEEYLVINKFLNNFNDKIWSDWKTSYAELCEEKGFSLDQIVTLASVVEAEGKTAADFEYISYVLRNRLSHADTFPNLESDATIQYAFELAGLPREKDPSKVNLEFPSPYNTYLHEGLPPGAICNPGLDAILAAIYPSKPLDEDDKEIDAYFFISNNAGKTYYAATKAGHERNKERVAKENEAMEKGEETEEPEDDA